MIVAPFVLFAHVFGQTYTLPVPLWLFLFGAGAAVAVSFFAIGLLADATQIDQASSISPKKIGALAEVGRFLGVMLFAMTIITGLVGIQDGLENFSVTAFWVIFLLGFTYLTLIFGNIWEFVSPFNTLLGGVERVLGEKKPLRQYPAWLGYWPALIGYFGLIWLELVGSGLGTTPHDLAIIIIMYTVTTLIGAYWFGREAWFKYGELFSVFFGLVSRIAPIRIKDRTFAFRRPLDGLITSEGGRFSLLLFILFMLASTGFDGLKETVRFGRFVELLPRSVGDNSYIVGSIGLALAPFVLLALYLPCVALVKCLSSTKLTVMELAYRFAFSLVPIAVAYHMAHYFTMLLITGQGIIPELSDPFGSGLNLLGTATYSPNVAFLGAATVWYGEVALIVIGHIGAVYVAHMDALKVFGSRRRTLLSQLPMVALMVLYTAMSLWIIAQPIAV